MKAKVKKHIRTFFLIQFILLMSMLLALIDIVGVSLFSLLFLILLFSIPIIVHYRGRKLFAFRLNNFQFWLMIIFVCLGFSWRSFESLSSNSNIDWFPRADFFLYAIILLILIIGFVLIQDSIADFKEEKKENIYKNKSKETFVFITSSVLITNVIFHVISISFGNSGGFIYEIFLRRGVIPIIITVFFIWALLVLMQSVLRTRFERDNFKLLTATNGVETKINNVLVNYFEDSFVKERSDFVFTLLKKNKNSSPAEIIELLNESIKIQYQSYFSNYNIIGYLTWVIPVLGFIGTVWGISESIQEIVISLSSLEVNPNIGNSPSELLGAAVQPLAVAFDTTLLALSLSAIIMLLLAFVKRTEDQFFSQVELYNQAVVLSSLDKI